MGGYGSGSWYRLNSKTTTESQNRIDVRVLKKWGQLDGSTYYGSWSWSSCGKEVGSINYRVDSECMVLNYRYRLHGGEWESVYQTILFERTACHYGRYRFWFLCPRCYRRVAVLYGAGKHFYCRHCHNLTYSCQQENKPDRLMRKARKIRARLEASYDLSMPILFKPKNMHQKTFDRLRKAAEMANKLSCIMIARRLDVGI